MELLPPRLSDPALFALIAEIIATRPVTNAGYLRLRLLRAGSWQPLFDLAEEQGLTAPLIWALDRRALLLPPQSAPRPPGAAHPTAQIRAVYRDYLQRRARQREQVVELIAALNSVDIVPFLLKGARYLVAPAGPWCEARTMRDLDIMVRKADALRAIAALSAQGYVADTQSIPTEHHLPEMWRAGFPSALEIHTDALAFSAEALLATDEVWRHGVQMSTEAGSCVVLPWEWHLLHGLLHHQVSDRGHRRKVLAAGPLWEFAWLGSELPDQAWRSIAATMAERGAGDVLGSWIALAETLYRFELPGAVAVSPAARAHAEATLAWSRAADWRRRGRFLADQLRFAFSPKTLSVRYRDQTSSPSRALRHMHFLADRYRGRVFSRLFGRARR
ncbi:MAG: nucleotidyltransferase family protein [Xanthobacteraceae bacterium]|nr:nucleotidyltransferase family protein [Xanthobacteraceae bacterium]